MFRGARKNSISLCLLVVFLLFLSLNILSEGYNEDGNLLGFIFGADKTTPLEGAVIRVQNISSGNIYESSVSDSNGLFKIESMEKGIYLFGVKTEDGNFNSNNLFGIRANETAKVSIALTPFDEKEQEASKELYQGQEIPGESLIGRVINYDRETKVAEVFIIKGMMQKGDRIHVKGEETDFHQDVPGIILEGKPVKRAFAGQTVMMLMEKDVVTGDLIYIICKGGALPIFLTPLGIATVIAGTGAIVYGFTELTDDPPAETEFRK